MYEMTPGLISPSGSAQPTITGPSNKAITHNQELTGNNKEPPENVSNDKTQVYTTVAPPHIPTLTRQNSFINIEKSSSEKLKSDSVTLNMTAPRKSALDRDLIEGIMTIHLKKPKKKLFKTNKSSLYVIADSRKPIVEIFKHSNESKSELVYVLSLANAVLSFESDDANIVMEKCFCVEVKTWKKKSTVHFKNQGFIFYEEDQVRMLLWVKCIHHAIKKATKSEVESDFFRSSVASAISSFSEAPFSDEEGDSRDPDVESEDADRKETLRSRTESSTTTATSIHVVAKETKHTFNRINQIFHHQKNSAKSTLTNSSALESKFSTKTSGSNTFKERALQLSPKLMHSLQISKNGLGAQVNQVAGSNIMKVNEVSVTPGSSSSAAMTDSLPPMIQPLIYIKAGPHNERPKMSVDKEKSTPNPTNLQYNYLRSCMLLICLIAGMLNQSVFLSLAVVGAFNHYWLPHEDFQPAIGTSIIVFYASRIQTSLGVCCIFGIMYLWAFAEYKIDRRNRRNRIAESLMQEERDHFAHVQIPSWIEHPDVDRVEWVNKILHKSWPFLKIAIKSSLLYNVNPLLDTQKPSFMSSLSIVRIDLGIKVPHISGVKFVSAASSNEEISLDIEVRIVTDRTFLADLKMVSNLGAAAVISIRDLFLVGTLRLTFKPLWTEWPCFSGLTLSFTSQPVFDFSITAAKINIANVPFASEWLHTFLHDLLIDYFVWPKVLEIPLWDQSEFTSPDRENLYK